MRRFSVVFCVALLVAVWGVPASLPQAQVARPVQGSAQPEAQGKYVNSASARLVKLVDAGNRDGYKLQDNAFSIGGGWLKQSTSTWVPLYGLNLTAGKNYRFIAVGDLDARDLDLAVVNDLGNPVASDTANAPEAVVNFRPNKTGVYTVKLRLYASDNNEPSVCISTVMVK
jgi:hypothetical protein